MRRLQPTRRGVDQAFRWQPRLRHNNDIAGMRCGGKEQRRITADHLE